MTHRTRFHEEGTALSPADMETIVRLARVSTLGQAIGTVLRDLWAAPGRFRRAVDEACRLRALASLDDHRLSALGLTRADLPGIVYGWRGHDAPAVLLGQRERLDQSLLPHRQMAA